jgi:hypothetical protein
MPPDAVMEVLFETVADRFTHGGLTRYTPFSNWILWAWGGWQRNRGDIQDPDLLLRGGHSVLCGDSAFVLLRLAEKAGIPGRLVLLDGHIIMEAYHSGAWRAYDPDFEVTVTGREGSVMSVEDLSRDPDRVRQAYAGRLVGPDLARIVELYENRDDDLVREYPPPDVIMVRGQRPGRVERLAGTGKFVLPAAMILAGAVLGVRANPTPRTQQPET